MTVGIVMTVCYYRLPPWAYGLEHQNTAPELRAKLHARLPLSFVRQRSRKAPRLQADAELATPLGPPQRLTEACKIDISHNVGNKVTTVGIVITVPLCVVLIFQTVITMPTVITLYPSIVN